jgi:hypothetical protein
MAWPLGSDGGGEEVSSAVASKARFDRPILLRGQIKHSGLRVELICGVAPTFISELSIFPFVGDGLLA